MSGEPNSLLGSAAGTLVIKKAPTYRASDASDRASPVALRPIGQKLFFLHTLFGFLFACVDPDGFLPELNPFTLDWLFGGQLVSRAYNWGFALYFCAVAITLLSVRQRRWWRALAIGVALYSIYGLVRLFADGNLFQIYLSLDIRSVFMLALIAAFTANPKSWHAWLKPFFLGAGAALLMRVVCHFLGKEQQTTAMIGVDTQGFYGTFLIHCTLMFGFGIMAAFWFAEHRRWGWMTLSLSTGLAFLAVIISGFRRTSIIEAILVAILGFCIAFWLRKRVLRGVLIAIGISLFMVVSVSTSAIAFYGPTAAWERLLSLVKPTEESASKDSNLSYLDDWDVLGQVLRQTPLGIGYGNSYGVPRYLDMLMATTEFGDFEPPLHVGPFDLVARTGPFGAFALVGFLWSLGKALLFLRGRTSDSETMIAGGCAAFFLVVLFFPSAPTTSEIKFTASFGLALGIVFQLAARVRTRRLQRVSDPSYSSLGQMQNILNVPPDVYNIAHE